MKKRFLLYFALITSINISAQTQQGYVRTIGRPDKKGKALGGVIIRAKGEHNTVLSEDDGTFSIPFHGLKTEMPSRSNKYKRTDTS